MDFANATKPSPAAGVNVVARTDVVRAPDSVAVELPPEKTVQSAQAGDPVKVEVRAKADDAKADARQQAERRSEETLRDVIQRRLLIEPTTRSIVLQKTNRETGETVQTVPDEATLKLRVMARAVADRARALSEATSHYVERSA